MGKITYTNKEDAQITATLDTRKVRAADMNEIKSSINSLYDERGWAYYADSEASSQTFTTSPSLLTIDASGAATITTQLPTNVTSFWNSSTNRITPELSGDAYDIRIDFDFDSRSGNPTRLILQLDIGGQATPTNVVAEKSIRLFSPAYRITDSIPIFTLSTFVANGGQIFLSVDTGSVTLGFRGIMIKRDYSDIRD